MRVTAISSLIALLLCVVNGYPESKKSNNIPSNNIDDDKIQVTYIVLPSKNQLDSINLHVAPETSLFDIMENANKTDYDNFRFTHKMYNWPNGTVMGAYITSIGGVAEVKNKYHFWMLYNCTKHEDPAQYHTLNGCSRSENGVSITYPKNGDIWLWNYQYYNWLKKDGPEDSTSTEEPEDVTSTEGPEDFTSTE